MNSWPAVLVRKYLHIWDFAPVVTEFVPILDEAGLEGLGWLNLRIWTIFGGLYYREMNRLMFF